MPHCLLYIIFFKNFYYWSYQRYLFITQVLLHYKGTSSSQTVSSATLPVAHTPPCAELTWYSRTGPAFRRAKRFPCTPNEAVDAAAGHGTHNSHTHGTHTHTHTCSEFTVTAATVTVFAVFYNPFPFWPCTRQGKNKTKPAKRTQRNRQEEERSDIALSMCVCVFICLCVSVCLARHWRPLPWRSLGASPVCHYVHASGLYFGRNFVYLRVLAAVAVAAQVPIRPKRPAISPHLQPPLAIRNPFNFVKWPNTIPLSEANQPATGFKSQTDVAGRVYRATKRENPLQLLLLLLLLSLCLTQGQHSGN